jgi:hypothetical protein
VPGCTNGVGRVWPPGVELGRYQGRRGERREGVHAPAKGARCSTCEREGCMSPAVCFQREEGTMERLGARARERVHA